MNAPAPAAHGRIIHSEFRPHPLLRGPHVQTVLPTLLRPSPRIDFTSETLELSDGDFVHIGWTGREAPGNRVAILVHGLGGSFRQSKYLRGLARLLVAAGWRVGALQLRGSGDTPNRLARSYHHGDTGDLRHLCRLLKDRDPQARLAVVGWSLGANVVLKATGEEGANAPFDAAVGASAPFLLEPCAHKLRTGFARVYQARLLRDLHQMLGRKRALLEAAGIDFEAVRRSRDFFEFDDAYTAPLNGFANARDYYARCACGNFLKTIARPTLIINAADDPFMARNILPKEEALSPTVTLEIARRGGHVGFISAGPNGRLSWWLEQRIAEWLEAAMPA